jgi:hypothetical protein
MHPSTNRRIWQPINTRPHSASPRAIAEPVSPPPARIFAAPRPAFPNPRTQPLTPCPSNRYSEKIEFHVSYRKQSTLTFSNRYIHRGSFAAGFLPNPRFPLTPSTKINRKPGKIEHLVSHRKQRTATQINRKLSGGPRFPFSHSPNPPVTGLEHDPETPHSGGRRALTFPSSSPKGESASVAPGFGVWSATSVASYSYMREQAE